MSLKILLKGQLQYMNQYFEVIGVSSEGHEHEDIQKNEGIRTIKLNMSREITPLQDLVSLVKMIFLILKEKPDIVHTHTPKAGLIGMLASFVCRVPHRLHTVAGLPVMEAIGGKRRLLLMVEKLTYACATKIYPNAQGLKEFIVTHNLTKENKLKVLGNGSSNGIDTNHFQVSDELLKKGKHIRSKYNIASNQFIFIFVGRIVKDKGINELLSAFNKLSLEEKNIKLLLVGPFEDTLDPISDKSKEILKTNKNIILTGFQNDVRSFFSISNCLVFPSYREGFPNVVLQAGAMGLPSIVSDINGCNEIIKDKINGFIIPPKDENTLFQTMHNILNTDEVNRKLTINSRKLIINRYDQKFVWKTIKNEYITQTAN
jgi:glycosyltransferase involved in cell wall biosynthesis